MRKKAFGYLPWTRRKADDDGKRQVDEDAKKLVVAAYDALLDGKTLAHIAAIFNDAQAYGLNGKPWTPSTVSLFLRSPRNAGLRDYNGEIIGEGTWAPLVKESTWRAAQNKLSAPGRAPGRKSVQKHLLTGVLTCGLCGHHLGGMWVRNNAQSIVYSCKGCHRVGIRAAHVEPLLYRIIGERLARADAVDLLKAEIHDEAEAESIRLELQTLYGELDNLALERAQGLMTGRQLKVSSDFVQAKIDELEHRQDDQERLMVFEGLPLGTPEVVAAVKQLTPDRFRAVVAVLLTVTIAPVGKGHRANGGLRFDPERVQIDWRT